MRLCVFIGSAIATASVFISPYTLTFILTLSIAYFALRRGHYAKRSGHARRRRDMPNGLRWCTE